MPVYSAEIWGRNNMKFILLVISVTLLAACSGTKVTQLGPNTYQATPGQDKFLDLKKTVGDTPTKVCAKFGKKPLAQTISGNGVIVFKCLDEDDPEYVDIDYSFVPDVVIEQK
jgi:hypothetical protein